MEQEALVVASTEREAAWLPCTSADPASATIATLKAIVASPGKQQPQVTAFVWLARPCIKLRRCLDVPWRGLPLVASHYCDG